MTPFRSTAATNFFVIVILASATCGRVSGRIQNDSPCFGDCAERDPELLKSVRELTGVIRSVQASFKESKEEVSQFTQALRDCEMCKSRRNTGCQAQPPPCFPGVDCREHSDGQVQCGACPRGYQGDGRRCVELTTCRDRPCFPGVVCYDTEAGFQCGPCPVGYRGNGQECHVEGTTEANTRPPPPHRPSYQYEHHRGHEATQHQQTTASRPCDIYSIIHRNCTYGVMRLGGN